jgi:hypothetical protein
MNPPMNRSTQTDQIPALRALGDQFDLVAADAVLVQQRRRPAPWPSILAPALVVLAVVLGLSVKLTPPAEAVVLRAAERTAASDTGRFAMSTRVTGGATVGALELSTDGIYDRTTGRLRTTVDLRRALGGASPSAIPGLDGTVDTIEDGTTIYLHAPVFEEALPDHKPWVKVETSQLATSSPLAAAASLDGTVTDPSTFLEALRGIGEDTHVVAREVIDGVSKFHYRGTGDLARAAAALPAGDRDRLRQGFDRLGVDQSAVQIPMDVWVDELGNVRRVRTDVQVADRPENDATLRGSVITVTVDYRDVGMPERIVVPDPSTVTDVTDLVNGMLSGPLSGAASSAPR